jgi:hypothetical protein
MKRALIAAVLLLIPCALFSFDTKRHAPRVGVLRVSNEYSHADAYVATNVVRRLREELVERGVDAYDTGLTYEEIADGQAEDADYYVEILGASTHDGSLGGIGVGSQEIGVSVDVVVSRVAAEVRVYDGPTGKLLTSKTLSKRKTAVMPTSIYLAGSRLFAVVAMPFVQQSQYRSLTKSAARDAALVVVEALQPE